MKEIQNAKKRSQSSGVYLWLVLLKAFHSMSAYAAGTLRDSDLGESDFRVLEMLLHKGPQPVNALGPKVFLTPGSISVAVDRLHGRGLVSREEGPSDRRVRVVALTAKGKQLIERVFAAHAASIETLTEVLSPGERKDVARALKKLGKHAAASLR